MVDFMPRRAAATFTAKARQEHVERAHGLGKREPACASDAAFDVDISSNSGPSRWAIRDYDRPGPHPGVEEERVGKVRGGGPTVSVHTGSGDVQVD